MLLALYLATGLFGMVLIGVSLLLGGHDKDFDKDLDLDHDADVDLDHDHDHHLAVDFDLDGDADVDLDLDLDLDADLDADVDLDADLDHDHDAFTAGHHEAPDAGTNMWIPFLSMRFWTFALATFGATGSLLTLVGLHWLAVLALASMTGMVLGIGAAWFFRRIARDSVSGSTSLKRFVGQEARAQLNIAPDKPGKILIETMAGDVELLALTRDDAPIERGSTVLIVHVEDHVAHVTTLEGPKGDLKREKAALIMARRRATAGRR